MTHDAPKAPTRQRRSEHEVIGGDERSLNAKLSPSLRQQYREALIELQRLVSPCSPLRQQWSDFLRERPWSWFATLTFHRPVHPEQGIKRWGRWLRALQGSLEACSTSPAARVIWARADELQRRGVLHFHALIAGVADVPISTAVRLWRRVGGGSAKIEPYDRNRGAAFYLSKGADIELSEAWFERSNAPHVPSDHNGASVRMSGEE